MCLSRRPRSNDTDGGALARPASAAPCPIQRGIDANVRPATRMIINEDGVVVIVATIEFGMGIENPTCASMAPHLDLRKASRPNTRRPG